MTPLARYGAHLRELLADALEPFIARAVPLVIRRSLRRGLAGVWVRGADRARPALARGAVLAPNHHGWWDGYLLWLLRRRLGFEGAVLVEEATLRSFPYFRRLGALGRRELRAALRRLERGHVLVVFPEGVQRPPGALGPLRPGAAFLARRGGAPLVPLAIRVVLRGEQHPEAYLAFGAPLEPAEDDAATTDALRAALGELLLDLDRDLAAAPLDAAPPGFERWLGGARSTHRRAASLEALWRR